MLNGLGLLLKIFLYCILPPRRTFSKTSQEEVNSSSQRAGTLHFNAEENQRSTENVQISRDTGNMSWTLPGQEKCTNLYVC